MTKRYALSDEHWERIKDLLPGLDGQPGATARDNRLLWSRDEVTGIGFEYNRIFLPGFNNGLVGCFPSQRLKVFGKVEGADEDEHMRLQALQIKVMEGFDRGPP